MRPPLIVTLLAAAAAIAVGGAVLASDAVDEWPTAASSPSTSPGEHGSAGSGPDEQGRSAKGTPGDPESARPIHHEFPVAGCDVSYARTHHDYPAADVFTDRGCRFVAPVAGYVDEVVEDDTWKPSTNRGADRGGRSVSVVGDDGVRYYGSHLAEVEPGIRPGVEVDAGQTLGRVGDSGSARGTGSHLHFGISWPTPPGRWWIRRGVVAPQPYLDSWMHDRERSPVKEIAREERRYGDDSTCQDYC